MVSQVDAHHAQHIPQLMGNSHILRRRQRKSAGVIVRQHRHGGSGCDRQLHHLTGGQIDAGHIPFAKLLTIQEFSFGIQAQKVDSFLCAAHEAVHEIAAVIIRIIQNSGFTLAIHTVVAAHIPQQR